MFGDDLREHLGSRVPGDHSRQSRADQVSSRALGAEKAPHVLDLGCGNGDSIDFFRRVAPRVKWVGIDIEDSAEVRTRTRTDAEFHVFDGEHIPLADHAFDLVFCVQVLEHVARVPPLLADAARVLRPGGHLVGSTSQLEPFHSRSTANPTPYGLNLELEKAGLKTLEMRPGIDSLTLIVRRGLGGPGVLERFWTSESPLNRLVDLYGRFKRLDPQAVNAAKLVLCGQFVFLARKPL
ncbi:MAG: class I SAM-dependent methyltransferase [Thermoleophilaceae bacterium]